MSARRNGWDDACRPGATSLKKAVAAGPGHCHPLVDNGPGGAAGVRGVAWTVGDGAAGRRAGRLSGRVSTRHDLVGREVSGVMSEEWFDVVDEQDRVIGRELRREVHRRKLLHRAVHVLVLNCAGKVFLQKRSMKKDSAPGAWDSSASGHVDSGETYDVCAPRELREELGVEAAAPIEPLFKLPASEETAAEFVWVYRTCHEGPFVLHPDEIESGAWFTPGEVDAAVRDRPAEFARSFRHIWGEARRRGLV